jgi:hypothetical protein
MEGWAVIARRLSEIQAQAIDWLWLGWLASGKLTLVDGDADVWRAVPRTQFRREAGGRELVKFVTSRYFER